MANRSRVMWMIMTLFALSLPLAAQQIDVQRPLGASLVHDAIDNVGSKAGFDEIRLKYFITNLASVPLSLSGSPTVLATAPKNIQYVLDVPPPKSLNENDFEDFELSIKANGHGAFALNLTIASNDPNTPEFVIRVRGNTGTKEKKDDDCSTREATGAGGLAMLGAFSAALLAVRSRRLQRFLMRQ